MALNKFLSATFKIISAPDINLKKNYKLIRKFMEVTNFHILKPFYKIWDYKVSLDNRDIPVRIFSPDEEGIYPVLIFFHGGGFVTGNIDTYNKVCCNMANNTKHIVVSVDYRLAPEHPYPAALNDCYQVTKEIFLHPELFKIKAKDITLIGDSAGANLVAALSLMARDKKAFFPSKQILIYPLVDTNHSDDCPYPSVKENGNDYVLTTKKINDYLDLYIENKKDLKNPYVAPILAKDLTNQPKTLILTAEFDPLRDEGEAYGKKLASYNNQVTIKRMKDVIHGFFNYPINNIALKESYNIINQFLNEEMISSEKEQ